MVIKYLSFLFKIVTNIIYQTYCQEKSIMALNKAIEIIKLEIAERRVKSKNPLTRNFTMDEEIESLEEALSILSFNPLSVNVFGLEPEIREIDGVSYSVQKVPCACSCHRTGAVHFAPCCNNGYKEILRKIE